MPNLLTLRCYGLDEITLSIESAPELHTLDVLRAELTMGYHALPKLRVLIGNSGLQQVCNIATSVINHLCCVLVPHRTQLRKIAQWFEGQPINLMIYNLVCL